MPGAGDPRSVEDGVCAVPTGEIPLSALPPLPARGSGYHSEPIVGFLLVVGICCVLVGLSFHGAVQQRGAITIAKACLGIVALWAAVAISCIMSLLFGAAPDEIKRSNSTCYPMPAEVAQQLLSGRGTPLTGSNVDGPRGSPRLGTYCVRCLVWRPPPKTEAGRPHHCNVCQRCVVGFDHHCNLFGRCITRGNLPTFYLLVSMLPMGVVTALMPMVMANGGQ